MILDYLACDALRQGCSKPIFSLLVNLQTIFTFLDYCFSENCEIVYYNFPKPKWSLKICHIRQRKASNPHSCEAETREWNDLPINYQSRSPLVFSQLIIPALLCMMPRVLVQPAHCHW